MNYPSELCHLFPPPGCRDIMAWRNTELREILLERDGGCWVEGCSGKGISDIHEAIRRGHVKGQQPKSRRLLIFNGINSVILCREKHHNTELEPKISELFDWMAEQYGLDVMFDWVTSLKFKGPHPAQEWIRGVVDGWGALSSGKAYQ